MSASHFTVYRLNTELDWQCIIEEFNEKRKETSNLKDHNMLVSNARYTNGKVILQSFNKHSLKRFHNLNSNGPFIKLGKSTLDDKDVKDLKQYADSIGPDYDDVGKDYVQKPGDYELLAHSYIVNDKEDMHQLFD